MRPDGWQWRVAAGAQPAQGMEKRGLDAATAERTAAEQRGAGVWPGGRMRPAPLGPLLLLTFLNSLGTGVVTTGISFLAKSAYGFQETDNYFLGLILGITYVIGAFGAGPALRGLRRRHTSVSTRTVLVWLMAAMGAISLVPLAAQRLAGGEGGGAWAVWVLIALYSPMTGVLWPVVESYMSGGRSSKELRATMGAFNVVWSSALVAGYLVMAPLIEKNPLVIVGAVGGIHVFSILIVLMLTPDPAGHQVAADETQEGEETGGEEAERRLSVDLLGVFRILLPTSYLVFSALTPYLPTALDSLGIAMRWQTPVAATWMASRVLTFLLLERWHGWHGRWLTAVAGCVLLISGFAGAVLAARLGPGTWGLTTLVVGLAGFGVGMGTIYTSALYYALKVGAAQVEAGGTHEALIGCGYTAGPLCGLLAAGAVRSGTVGAGSFSVTMLALAGALATGVCVYAMRRVWHGSAKVRGV